MIYRLEEANLENKNLLIEWKLNNIFEYANDLDKEEIDRINNYVINNVTKEIDKYKLIMIDNEIIGCLLLVDYEDGIMIDEIYIINDYRCKGIGTSIIKNILKNNNIIYLWVYKNNIKALKLYERLLFNVVKVTETRFLMKYTNV